MSYTTAAISEWTNLGAVPISETKRTQAQGWVVSCLADETKRAGSCDLVLAASRKGLARD